MGQFSWLSVDTNEQILSDKPKGFQKVKMVYKQNNEIKEVQELEYSGYGEFGGVDYYEALLWTNNLIGDRELGIKMSFEETTKYHPQLYLGRVPNYSNIDFTNRPEEDPNQGWEMAKSFEDEEEY